MSQVTVHELVGVHLHQVQHSQGSGVLINLQGSNITFLHSSHCTHDTYSTVVEKLNPVTYEDERWNSSPQTYIANCIFFSRQNHYLTFTTGGPTKYVPLSFLIVEDKIGGHLWKAHENLCWKCTKAILYLKKWLEYKIVFFELWMKMSNYISLFS